MQCEYCVAFFGMYPYEHWRYEQHIAKVAVKQLARGVHPMGFGQILLAGGEWHVIWEWIERFLEQHDEYCPASWSTRNSGHDRCYDLGRSSAAACRWRTLIIMPLLKDTAMDFWNVRTEQQQRVPRDGYHLTVEFILLFLTGIRPYVIRPLPSLERLQCHNFLKVHPHLIKEQRQERVLEQQRRLRVAYAYRTFKP